MYPQDDQAAVEEVGTVKWYNAVKGFGFIGSGRGGKDIFVQRRCSTVWRRRPAEGQRVVVNVVECRTNDHRAGGELHAAEGARIPDKCHQRARTAPAADPSPRSQ
jgi:cold shock protein